MEHLNSNNILIDGFRSQHSFITNLARFTERSLSYDLDQQKQTNVILLDCTKVFDSVPHQRLLRHYGDISKSIIIWLTRRSQ